MQLQIKKIVCIKKLHACTQLRDISLISMYEVVFLFFYYWQFTVLKNGLQFKLPTTSKLVHYNHHLNRPSQNAITNVTSKGIHSSKQLFITSYIETSVAMVWEFVQNKFILSVL